MLAVQKQYEVVQDKYDELLINLKSEIQQVQQQIIQYSNYAKVKMSWQIGYQIQSFLASEDKLNYGDQVMVRIADDINISKTVLYRMLNFYQAYPELPEPSNLSWSHYRILSSVKDLRTRKALEDLTAKNGWSEGFLRDEAIKVKDNKSSLNIEVNTVKKKKSASKLRPQRGTLYLYLVSKINNKSYLDLGFNVFRELGQKLEHNGWAKSLIRSNKFEQGYQLEMANKASKRQLHIYKAYLDRVVDGDTIRVTFDLGFGILHKEIVRLKGINAPELKTIEGKKSKAALENILSNRKILIVKTIKIDIYGRYVGDVYFNNNSSQTPQEIADNGDYLNQILLDNGWVHKV